MNPHPLKPSLISIAFLGAAQILVWGGSFFLMAVIADPVVLDTGWPRKWVFGALSLGILVSGLLAPAGGRLVARYGGRLMLACSGWIIGAGLVALSFAHSLPMFLGAWLIIGLGMAAGLYEALFATLGQLYGREARSAIIGVTLFGGFSTTLTWPVMAFLIEHIGWRMACLAYAGLLAVTIWPLSRAALPRSLASSSGHSAQVKGRKLAEPQLYHLLSAIFALGAVVMTAMSVHLLVLLQGSGYSLAAAIGLSAIVGPCQVGARIIDILNRRASVAWTTAASGLFAAIGLLLLAAWPQAAVAGVALYGAGNGLRAIVRGTLPLLIWRPDEYAVVLGRMARPALLAQAATPLAGGYLIEAIGARSTLWCLCAVAAVNAGLVLWLLRLLRRRESMQRA